MEDIKFDLVSALNVIAIDKSLTNMFKTKFPPKKDGSFDLVIAAAKKGTISASVTEYVEGVFENAILKRKSYIEKYTAFQSAKVSEEPVVIETPVKVKPTASSNSKKLPKEYNKTRIMADITARGAGAKKTLFERAMLEICDVKNMRAKISNRGKRFRYNKTDAFTDEELRDIIAVVKIFKNKLGKL